MAFTSKTRYLLTFLAILTGSLIELFRGYRSLIVAIGFLLFLAVGFTLVYLSGSKERALRRKQKRDYYAGALLLVFAFATIAHAQLLGPPPIPAKNKKVKARAADLEWMWQYGPPPPGGRENELIQDAHFRPFLDEYFTAPQAFWGPNPTDPKSPTHRLLADTVYDFLAIPNKVVADDNRYLTITGHVFHFAPSRGLIFADLNSPHPLVVFAAVDWIRDGQTTDQANAEYTLWLFPNQPPGPSTAPDNLPPALLRSLTRWMSEPIPGSAIVPHITSTILVLPDGTPHQIPVPGINAPAAKPEEAAPLKKRQ